VHRTMHILDVISSVSRSSKRNKIVGGWGFAPDPTGRADNSLAGLKWAYFKDPNSQGSGMEGREEGMTPK